MIVPAFSDLDDVKLKVEILKQTCAQIQKDFNFYDTEFELKRDTINSYEELFEQVEPYISRLLDLDPGQFFNLIYRIDLDEKQIKAILFGPEAKDASHRISNLILEREIKKVMLRMYLKKHF